jgi:hypothetical protein
MANGQQRPIESVRVGEVVRTATGGVGTVRFVERVQRSRWGRLYSPNASIEPFATINHPLVIDGQIRAPLPAEVHTLYPWLGRVAHLPPSKVIPDPGGPVFNLWVDGDGTYVVNGVGAHSIAASGGVLPLLFSIGPLTEAEVLSACEFFAFESSPAWRLGVWRMNQVAGVLADRGLLPHALKQALAQGLLAVTRQRPARAGIGSLAVQGLLRSSALWGAAEHAVSVSLGGQRWVDQQRIVSMARGFAGASARQPSEVNTLEVQS